MRLLRALLCVGLCLAVRSSAQAVRWDVGGGGSWNNGANWQGGLLPGASEAAEFANDISGTATVTLDGDRTVASLRFADSSGSDGNWTISAGSLTAATITVDNERATIDATIHGSNGLTKLGDGMLILSASNQNSDFVGTVSINAGTLRISHISHLGASANAVTIANGATLQITESIIVPSARAVTIGLGGGTIDVSDNREFRLNNSGFAFNGPLTKVGAGNLLLNKSGSGGGGAIVTEGVLEIGKADALGTGSIRLTGGAFYFYQSNPTNLTAPIVLAGGTLFPGADHNVTSTGKRYAGDITLVNSTTSFVRSLDGKTYFNLQNPKLDERNLVLSGKISDNGNLELSARGDGEPATKNIEFWNTSNDFTGTITVHAGVSFVARGDGGTLGGTTTDRSAIRFYDEEYPMKPGRLSLRNDSAMATSYKADLVVDSAATIDANRDQITGATHSILSFHDLTLRQYALTITGGNGFQIRIDGTTTLDADATIDTQTANLILQGPVVGSGGITKTGPGRLELTATSNRYTGDTRVDSGILLVVAGVNSDDTRAHDTIIGTTAGTAELITAHIRQDALTINAGSRVTIQTTGGASGTSVVNLLQIANSSGNFSWDAGGGFALGATGDAVNDVIAAPEPAAWTIAIVAALTGLAAYRWRGKQ